MMRTRKDIETLEQQVLAPYGMKSCESHGRFYDEDKHLVRTCYQRDRDRIVHAEAFRKLEYKTQVFVIFEGDYYRTRLTHTIEVAQVARTIGRSLRLNEDLIEAIALAHDLGHPPFGHAGEAALNRIMKEKQGLEFNHNLRSFHIVTHFEKRYPDFDGLNLTEEVLMGILKHRTLYDKPGVAEEYKNIGPTLEALVVDVADSLTYLSHDIDDGLTSGCITEEDLMDSKMWQKAYQHVEKTSALQTKDMMKYQIVKALIDMQIKDFLTTSSEILEQHDFRCVEDVKDYNLKHLDDPLLRFSSVMKTERDCLQNLLNEKLYHHFRVVRMTDKAQRIVKDIFEVYVNNLNQLPYDIYDRHSDVTEKEKYEIVCNYIASMTDRFALDEHKKLFNPYQKV